MEKVPLSEYEVAPLDDIADHVTGLRIVFVNVFAITTPAGWTLIDAGLPFSAGRIRSSAERQFGERGRSPCSLTAISITPAPSKIS
jgi:hypothetical protein